MNPTDRVLQFIQETDWHDIPSEVQHQAKRCFLDTLGALLAGMETPVSALMTRFATQHFRGDDATILVSGRRTSLIGAALANGFAGNALDIDDGYRLVKGHPGACILPVLLATSQITPSCSGSAFLTALIVGYEVGIRAGLIHHALYETYHASGSWGSIGGAAAAGKILGLNTNALCNAMGTAEYHAPIAPMMKCIQTPSMVKDGIGWGAMVAMSSVLMAQVDFTGIQPLFRETPQENWIEDLGSQYEIMNIYFKPYAACRWAQPAIAGAVKIRKEYRISPDKISLIRIRTFEAAVQLSRRHPRNTEEAQYNMAYPVAAAMLDGEVGPLQVMTPRIHDASLICLADKVEAEVEETFEKAFPAKAYAEVIIHTKDGRLLTSGPVEARWERPHTLPSDAELEEKFCWLVDPLLGSRNTQMIASMTWELEKVEGMRRLIDYCVRNS